MAKTLHERQKSALSSSARLADCRAVLADTEAESSRLLTEASAASSRATDPDVEPADAREARVAHTDMIHQSEREDAIAIRLHQKIERLEADEVTASKRRAYDTALKERDSLRDDLVRDYGPAVAIIVQLLSRLKASNAAVAAVNMNLPKGRAPISCPECEVRGLPGLGFTMANGHVPTLLTAKLPAPDGAGLAWPKAAGSSTFASAGPVWGDMVAEARAAAPPKFQRVRLEHWLGGVVDFRARVADTQMDEPRNMRNGEWTGWVPIAEAARLERMSGVTLDRMEVA